MGKTPCTASAKGNTEFKRFGLFLSFKPVQYTHVFSFEDKKKGA
jgi:hypothetical protein